MRFRKLVFVFGLLFAVALLGFALIQNRDRNRLFFERIDSSTYITTDLPKLLYLNSLETNTNLLSFVQKSSTNECLNGKDPSKLGPKEQLLEFIKGPCLPVVAVPGFLASKFTVKIDCETFQESNPEIFKACGWSTCTWWKMWSSMPRDEYTLWISDFLGPVSILFHDSVKCWGNIIQLNYESKEIDIRKKYTSPKGVEIDVFGNSEKTQSQSNCGFGAINNILPVPIQTLYSKGFNGIHDALVKMGYQPGLNLYATPYDWRKTTIANGVTTAIKQAIMQNYELTGKPTVLIAHSLGNFGALHFLNSLTQEEKDKYIANYVSVTNPLAGSPKALKTFIGGDRDYIYKKFGINYYAQRMLVKGNSGAFDLLPKNIYNHFADSPWLKEWKIRAELEHKHDVRTPEGKSAWEEIVNTGKYTYKWFPHPLLNCSFGFEQRRDECGLYMYNWSETNLAVINNKTFTASETQLKSLFNEYVLSTNVSDHLFEDVRSNNIYELRNPEVPVTLIYGSHLATDMTYEWHYDPRDLTRKDDFAFSNSTFTSQGDQTVPTSSALLPALKWSWEFENKEISKVKNPKPVKTVEICSIHNNKDDIYDVKHEDGHFSVTSNEYIGLKCDCLVQKNDHPVLGQNCDHSDILNDSKFVSFITKIVNSNYKISNMEKLRINSLSDQDLKTISQNCPKAGAEFQSLDFILKEKPRNTTTDSPGDEEIIV